MRLSLTTPRRFIPTLRAGSPRSQGFAFRETPEDVALAILIVRLSAKIGDGWAAAGVGILFALAHIPALLSGGATLSNLGSLVIDSALAVAILFTLTRARDILWFWPLHFMLDLAQFDRIVLLGK